MSEFNAIQTAGVCGLCGHDPACGFATDQRGEQIVYLCHSDDHVSCYHLWTVYGARLKMEPA